MAEGESGTSVDIAYMDFDGLPGYVVGRVHRNVPELENYSRGFDLSFKEVRCLLAGVYISAARSHHIRKVLGKELEGDPRELCEGYVYSFFSDITLLGKLAKVLYDEEFRRLVDESGERIYDALAGDTAATQGKKNIEPDDIG